MIIQWWQLLIALVGTTLTSGVLIHLLDRWRYRDKPKIDIAKQAQELADLALTHARAEMERAWDAAERAECRAEEAENHAAQAERCVADLTIKVTELRARVDAHDENEVQLRTQLGHYDRMIALKDIEINELRIALSKCVSTE